MKINEQLLTNLSLQHRIYTNFICEKNYTKFVSKFEIFILVEYSSRCSIYIRNWKYKTVQQRIIMKNLNRIQRKKKNIWTKWQDLCLFVKTRERARLQNQPIFFLLEKMKTTREKLTMNDYDEIKCYKRSD